MATKKKAPAKKVSAKKATVKKKVAVKKPAAKKVAAKKAPVKKAAVKKATAKKAVAKKVVSKKPVVKKPVPKKVAPKTTAIKDRYTKAQIINEIMTNTELSKKQVQSVFDELSVLMERHIKPRSCGEFVLPGLMKVQTVKKPAKKARKGTNPFTGEEMMFKAKPASNQVKVRPLKTLKEMAEK